MSSRSEDVETIVAVPALREEAAAIVGVLDAKARPVGEAGVRTILTPLTMVFREVATEAQSDLFWRAYEAPLHRLPVPALQAAVRDYLEVGKWFPKPAELKELAEKHAAPIRQAAYRARKALTLAPPKPIERLDAEEVADLTKQTLQALAGFSDGMMQRTAGREVKREKPD